MSEVKKTKNYTMFKKNESNREIDSSNLKKLINSIKAQNMLEYRPIVVDSELKVIDGQHRLEAAKVLDVEVYYQVNQDAVDNDMILLNTTQKKWGTADYVNYYINKGYPEYVKFQDYARRNDLDLSEVIRSLPRGGSDCKSVQKGQLKFFNKDQLKVYEDQRQKYNEFIPHIKKHILSASPFLDGLRFEKALKMLIKNEDVDWDLFVKKATIKSDAFKVCATSEAYYLLFLDIYNWKNQNKVYPSIKRTEIEPKEYNEAHQLSMA